MESGRDPEWEMRCKLAGNQESALEISPPAAPRSGLGWAGTGLGWELGRADLGSGYRDPALHKGKIGK